MGDVDDGVFFMAFDDYLKYYDVSDVCYFHDNYHLSSFYLETDPNDKLYFKFKITKKGLYYFALTQAAARNFRESANYKYTSCELTLLEHEKESDKARRVQKITGTNVQIWFEHNCECLNYTVEVFTPWQTAWHEIGFNTYGPRNVDITAVSPVKY